VSDQDALIEENRFLQGVARGLTEENRRLEEQRDALLAALVAAEDEGTYDPLSQNPLHHELNREVVQLRRAAIARVTGETT
jgi:hypothetical protein